VASEDERGALKTYDAPDNCSPKVFVDDFPKDPAAPPAEQPLHGAWGRVDVALMKGKYSSVAGTCSVTHPFWSDIQVCMITCSAREHD
jgi:hypothetical protein